MNTKIVWRIKANEHNYKSSVWTYTRIHVYRNTGIQGFMGNTGIQGYSADVVKGIQWYTDIQK